MERLLYYYSSPSPLTIHRLKPTPFLPRLARFDSSKLGFPSPQRPDFTRVNSVSSNYDTPSIPSNKLPSLSHIRDDLPTGSLPKSQLIKQIAGGTSLQQKHEVTLGSFIVLSALIMFLVNLLFASPAFATFQTAARTGVPAATAAAVGTKLMRTELLSSAWTGFFTGCLHTLSGPDHLAALTPLSIGCSRMESAVIGALWGCGHDAGQVLFGLLFLLLKDRLHIEVIRTWGTGVVGLSLLFIGAMGIREASEIPTPCVALENGSVTVAAMKH